MTPPNLKFSVTIGYAPPRPRHFKNVLINMFCNCFFSVLNICELSVQSMTIYGQLYSPYGRMCTVSDPVKPNICFIFGFCLCWCLYKSGKGRDRITPLLTFAPLSWSCSTFSSLSSFPLLTLWWGKLPETTLALAAVTPLFQIPQVKVHFKSTYFPSFRLCRLLCVQSWIPTCPHELPLGLVLELLAWRLSALRQCGLQEGDQVSEWVDAVREILLPSLQWKGA